MGMTCSQLGQSPGAKKKLRMTACAMMILGGVLIGKILDVVKLNRLTMNDSFCALGHCLRTNNITQSFSHLRIVHGI